MTRTLSISRPRRPAASGVYRTTAHAERRMTERGVSPEDLEAALTYGRPVWTRGACVFAIGRKEASLHPDAVIDLGPLNGVQAVCDSEGSVLTVYRNRELRSLRPRRRTSRTHQNWKASGRASKK